MSIYRYSNEEKGFVPSKRWVPDSVIMIEGDDTAIQSKDGGLFECNSLKRLLTFDRRISHNLSRRQDKSMPRKTKFLRLCKEFQHSEEDGFQSPCSACKESTDLS